MTITALPTPPSRLDPVNFSERADAFLGALPQFVNEANSLEALTQYNALVGSCTNTLSIATGTKTISTQTNKAWVAGMYVYLIYLSDKTQTMTGTVSSYNASSGALIVNVTQVTGSGSYSNWNILTVNPPQSAANISGGSAGQILYQTAANTTGFMHPANAIAIATATGTANAITATYTPVITALADGMTLYVWTTTTNTTVNPTFTPASGTIPAKTIVKGSGTALEVGDIIGWAEFQYGAALDKWVLQNPARGVKTNSKIQSVGATVSANALTITLNPTSLDFRDSTLNNGATNTRDVTTQLSLVVPSGATLGTVANVKARLIIMALDNSGTVELGICNLVGGLSLDETGLISTTAISASASSASVVYSATARANVPYRVVGFVDITEATAGTWAAAPTLVQGVGGKALDRPAGITMSTTIAVTSGSAIDVTGIPAGAQRVTIHMDQIGTNGTSAKVIQIGSGSFLTSGYKSGGAYAGSGNIAGGSSVTNGFHIQSTNAVDRLCGDIKLSRLPGFVYEQSHILSTNISGVCTGGGTVVSNGSIDRVRLTTQNGTDSFVAGWLTISWEF